jgi:hypothetical protein
MSSTLPLAHPFKRTTQKALLEPVLARFRSARARRWVDGHNVLDFGCGADLWNLRGLAKLARERIGYDLLFAGQPPRRTSEGVLVVGALGDVPQQTVDRVLALACFEHIEAGELPLVLKQLGSLTTPNALIFGTVPTRLGKPVLEFLSFKLGIIDRSQIEDHKVYYDRARLSEVVARGGWRLTRYGFFQLGMNSWFTLEKA